MRLLAARPRARLWGSPATRTAARSVASSHTRPRGANHADMALMRALRSRARVRVSCTAQRQRKAGSFKSRGRTPAAALRGGGHGDAARHATGCQVRLQLRLDTQAFDLCAWYQQASPAKAPSALTAWAGTHQRLGEAEARACTQTTPCATQRACAHHLWAKPGMLVPLGGRLLAPRMTSWAPGCCPSGTKSNILMCTEERRAARMTPGR